MTRRAFDVGCGMAEDPARRGRRRCRETGRRGDVVRQVSRDVLSQHTVSPTIGGSGSASRVRALLRFTRAGSGGRLRSWPMAAPSRSTPRSSCPSWAGVEPGPKPTDPVVPVAPADPVEPVGVTEPVEPAPKPERERKPRPPPEPRPPRCAPGWDAGGGAHRCRGRPRDRRADLGLAARLRGGAGHLLVRRRRLPAAGRDPGGDGGRRRAAAAHDAGARAGQHQLPRRRR